MPYTQKKINENKVCVYKKETGEKIGCTTPKNLKKYIQALHANEPKNIMDKPVFNFIQNGIDNDGVATLHLYDTIGAYYDPETESVKCTINGKDFAKEIEYLQDKASCIHIRINSGGGNVLDGFAIIDAILNSKIPVYTINVGIAASIASLIFLAGKKRLMNDYSMLMIHNPSMSENENNKLLNIIKSQLLTFLGNNCNYTQQELSDLMDEETYFNATECFDSNLVDEIITTDRNVAVDKTNVLEMAKIYNSIIIKENDMKDVKNATADELDKDATFKAEKVDIKKTTNTAEEELSKADKEEEAAESEAEQKEEDKEGGEEQEKVEIKNEEKVLKTTETKTLVDEDIDTKEVVDDMEADEDMESVDGEWYDDVDEAMERIKNLKKDLKMANDKVAGYEAEAERKELEKVDNMLSHYVTSGAIGIDEVSNLKKLARVDFNSVENMLSKIGTSETKSKTVVNKEAVKIFDTVRQNPSPVNGREAWTIREWEKQDPSGLAKIKNETPEMYNSMFIAYYKK